MLQFATELKTSFEAHFLAKEPKTTILTKQPHPVFSFYADPTSCKKSTSLMHQFIMELSASKPQYKFFPPRFICVSFKPLKLL